MKTAKTKLSSKERDRLTKLRWAEVIAKLGLIGNPGNARYLWVKCEECGEVEPFGEVIAWACAQDDGSFDPSLQVIDNEQVHWFVCFDESGVRLVAIDGDGEWLDEREVQPIFARCGHKPTPAA